MIATIIPKIISAPIAAAGPLFARMLVKLFPLFSWLIADGSSLSVRPFLPSALLINESM